MTRISLRNAGQNPIRDLRLNVSDSAVLAMIRDTDVGQDQDLDLGFQLPPAQVRVVILLFRVQDCVTPLKLRGTLTYTLMVILLACVFICL